MFSKEFLESDKRPWYADKTSNPADFATALRIARETGQCYVAVHGVSEILIKPIRSDVDFSIEREIKDYEDNCSDRVVVHDVSIRTITHHGHPLRHLRGCSNSLTDILFLAGLEWFVHIKQAIKGLSTEEVKKTLIESGNPVLCYHNPMAGEYEAVGYDPEDGFIRFFTKHESSPITKDSEEDFGLKRSWDWDEEFERCPGLDNDKWVKSLYLEDYWTEGIEEAWYNWQRKE